MSNVKKDGADINNNRHYRIHPAVHPDAKYPPLLPFFDHEKKSQNTLCSDTGCPESKRSDQELFKSDVRERSGCRGSQCFQSDAATYMSGCRGSQCFGKRDLKGFVAISELKKHAVISEVKTKRSEPKNNDMPCTGSQCLGRKRNTQQIMSQNEPQQQNSEMEDKKEEGEMKLRQEKTKQEKEEKELKDYKKLEENNIEEEAMKLQQRKEEDLKKYGIFVRGALLKNLRKREYYPATYRGKRQEGKKSESKRNRVKIMQGKSEGKRNEDRMKNMMKRGGEHDCRGPSCWARRRESASPVHDERRVVKIRGEAERKLKRNMHPKSVVWYFSNNKQENTKE